MDAEITIVGAGVVGLAIAAELAKPRRTVLVLEKESGHGRATSSRNSGVIHAGLYYPAASLKARLCTEGNALLYAICESQHIPHKRVGKLVVATAPDEIEDIDRLEQQARANGIRSVVRLGVEEVRDLEPNVTSFGALLCPDTGILDVHVLMEYFLAEAKRKGGEIVYNTEVVGLEKAQTGFRITTKSADGDHFSYESEVVINAAGLNSDIVSNMAGWPFELHYCKGNYFSIMNHPKGVVTRLIYPPPQAETTGLGVHLTLDLNGRMKLGPDVSFIERIEDYRVEEGKAQWFYEAAQRFLPFLRRDDIAPDMAGIRPKLQEEGGPFTDFVIAREMEGFVNLVGIESPGLTAAPAIARYVKSLLS